VNQRGNDGLGQVQLSLNLFLFYLSPGLGLVVILAGVSLLNLERVGGASPQPKILTHQLPLLPRNINKVL
jgi:hypothetical protein